MADVRDSARTYGKSDPIDALAVARAALREPDLPVARLDGVERELRRLVDHREPGRRAYSIICRLRWHLHELDPGWLPPANIDRTSAFTAITAHLDTWVKVVWFSGWHGGQSNTCELTLEVDELTVEITEPVRTRRFLHCWPSSAAAR